MAVAEDSPSVVGRRRILWAQAHMPLLGLIEERYREAAPFAGERIGLCLHLEAKTARFALCLQRLGAEVAIAGSNPLSTQDEVAAALAEEGVHVYARRGVDARRYHENLGRVLAHGPTLVVDDGADLVARAATEGAPSIRLGSEETTTGILRLRALEREGALPFPMVAVNDTPMKRLFDNRFGTGQSVWDAVMRATNLTLAGRRVVVAGFGPCGRGVAERARGLGARVTVVEADPVRANEAWFQGFDVLTMATAAPTGDFFVTTTGDVAVIRGEHFRAMKDGAVLANAGHFDVEIDKEELTRLGGPPVEVRPGVAAYRVEGRTLYLLAEGRLVNLALGDGHPVEIMDLSFALQALALLHFQRRLADGDGLPRAVLAVPEEVDREVARLHAALRGIGIERLTPRQEAYLRTWREGTA